VIKAGAGTHGGMLSDRFGPRATIAGGWLVYAAAYGGFAVARTAWQLWALFAVYGLFHALTEGAERALVADLTSAELRGRAFGLFHAVTGAVLLPASLLTGALWERHGAEVALGAGGALAALAALLLLAAVPSPTRSPRRTGTPRRP
jgi:MFS family permease